MKNNNEEKYEPIKQFGNHNPDTAMIEKLKNYLKNQSTEEFKKEWKQILELGLEGPAAEDFIYQNNLFNRGYNKAIEDVISLLQEKESKFNWPIDDSKQFEQIFKKIKKLKK